MDIGNITEELDALLKTMTPSQREKRKVPTPQPKPLSISTAHRKELLEVLACLDALEANMLECRQRVHRILESAPQPEELP